jgi:hypothetical protein
MVCPVPHASLHLVERNGSSSSPNGISSHVGVCRWGRVRGAVRGVHGAFERAAKLLSHAT